MRTKREAAARSVLYVVSAPRSGSTLLDLLLGDRPDVTGVGEVWKISLPTRSRRTPLEPEKRLCSCGVEVGACPFWTAVAARLAEERGGGRPWRWADFPVENRPRRGHGQSRLVDLALVGGSPAVLRGLARLSRQAAGTFRSARNSWRLFDAVASATGAEVVVDSSKFPSRMKALHQLDPERLRVLHLVRDGRAHLASMKRTHAERRSIERIVTDWRRHHRAARSMFRTMPADRILRVRYEDLCDDVEGTLATIGRFAGLPPEPAPGVLAEREWHNIPGNPLLFRGRPSIRKDEQWKSTLSERDLREFERHGGRLNRALGYGR